jgi:hypothetical protein
MVNRSDGDLVPPAGLDGDAWTLLKILKNSPPWEAAV